MKNSAKDYKPLSRRILSLALLVAAVPGAVAILAVGMTVFTNSRFERITR